MGLRALTKVCISPYDSLLLYNENCISMGGWTSVVGECCNLLCQGGNTESCKAGHNCVLLVNFLLLYLAFLFCFDGHGRYICIVIQ